MQFMHPSRVRRWTERAQPPRTLSPLRSLSSMNREMYSGERAFRLMKCSKAELRAAMKVLSEDKARAISSSYFSFSCNGRQPQISAAHDAPRPATLPEMLSFAQANRNRAQRGSQEGIHPGRLHPCRKEQHGTHLQQALRPFNQLLQLPGTALQAHHQPAHEREQDTHLQQALHPLHRLFLPLRVHHQPLARLLEVVAHGLQQGGQR